jgi:hypothetical protein
LSLLPGFLRKREAPKPAAAAVGDLPLGTPAYYEVWGGLESANRARWFALGFATTVAFLSLILVRTLIRRPPVVIRVADSGQAEVARDAGKQPPVSEAEVKNFLTLFERFFMGLNAYTYDPDLRLAFSMMTQGFQAKADDMLKREGTIETVKANQSRITVVLTELKVLRDTAEVIECRVMGNRQIGSYKSDGTTGEVVFEHNIILHKVPRSEQAPYGILVEDFQESIYKK